MTAPLAADDDLVATRPTPIPRRPAGGRPDAPRRAHHTIGGPRTIGPRRTGGPRTSGGPKTSGGPRTAGGPRTSGGPRSGSARRPAGAAGAAAAAQVIPEAAPLEGPATEATPPPRKRHLHLVGPRSRFHRARKYRARVLVVGGGLACALVAFALVYLHILAAQRQFTLDRLNNQVDQKTVTYQQLRLRVADLSAPARIIADAERLGMTTPTSVTYLSAVGATPTTTTAGNGSTAPAGNDNWPIIKALIAGMP